MNSKEKKILILILILITIICYPKVINEINLKSTLTIIKKNYVSQDDKIEYINKKYINKLSNNKTRKSEEDFILGYIKNEEKYFETAYKKMDTHTDSFVKYYLYNIKAKETLDIGDINKAKEYTKEALNNVDLNKYDKSYNLVWKSLILYIDIDGGREYIVDNTQKIIDKSRIEKNTYMLRRYISPILTLLGERDEAIENLLQVIFLATENGELYTQVKSIIDLALIFIDMEGYEYAMETLDYALEKSKGISIDEDRISLQLYIYVNQCKIYFINNEFEKIKDVVNKIYSQNGKIKNEMYNDFLILAKVYDSMYMCDINKIDVAEKLLEESKLLLNNDKEILLSDKNITVMLGQIKLEYTKKNYEEAINICKELLVIIEQNKSFGYKLLVMEELEALYFITDNDKIFKLNKEVEKYKYQIKNDSAKSYFDNSISEYYNVKSVNQQYESRIKVLILIIIQIIAILTILIMYRRKKQKNELLQKDFELLNNQFEYQLNHYKDIKKYQEEVRILWHDMKNHVNILISLINSNDYQEIKRYLYKLDNHMVKTQNKSITQNKVLDAILTNKINKCNDNGIDINIDAKLPDDIRLEEMDICIIFGNLIDNAIEACNNISDINIKKYIDIKCGLKNDYIYIKIENSKENNISKVGNKFITSKSDKINHGLGIKSVKNSVEKYNGNLKINYEDIKFIVFITIKKR